MAAFCWCVLTLSSGALGAVGPEGNAQLFTQMDSQALAAVERLESDAVFDRLVGLANAGNPQAEARVGLHLFLEANASGGNYSPSVKYMLSALERAEEIDEKLEGQIYYALGVIYEDPRTDIAELNKSVHYLLIFIRDYSQKNLHQMVNSARLKLIKNYIVGGPHLPRNLQLVVVYAEQIIKDPNLSDSDVGRLTRDAAHISLGVAYYYGYDGVGINLIKAKDYLTKAINSSNPAFRDLAKSIIASIDQGT